MVNLESATQAWLRFTSSRPHLTPRLQLQLIVRARAGDERARAVLIETSLRLVWPVARLFTGRGVPLEDLLQEGAIGVIHAVDGFSPDRNALFSTYATHCIRSAIRRSLDRSGRLIRVPVHAQEKLRKIKAVDRDLERMLGRSPEMEEIACAAGESLECARELLAALPPPVSLSDPLFDEPDKRLGESLVDRENPSPQRQVFRKELEAELANALDRLPHRERRVMELLYGLGEDRAHSRGEIARALRISRQRVEQLETNAQHRLRQSGAAEKLRSYLEEL